MAKRRRKEQQHLRQESPRRRSYRAGGSSPAEKFEPGFPMNLLRNVKVFYIAGAAIMIGSVIAAAILGARGLDTAADTDDLPTATATPTEDPNATPTPTPTPDPRQFGQAEQVIDAEANDYRAIVKTSLGDFTIELFDDEAPNTVNSFVFLAQNDYFDGLTFHRVVSDFVIQAGDPKGDGTGGPGYTVAEEPNEIRNERGTVAMAKRSGATEFGSQWFVNLKDNPGLDFDNTRGDKFYPFGRVVEGLDVVDAIGAVPTDASQKPLEPVTITDIEIQFSAEEPGEDEGSDEDAG